MRFPSRCSFAFCTFGADGAAHCTVYAKVNGTLWQTQRMTISGIQADVDIYTVPCSPSPDSGRVGFSFVGASSPTPVSMSSKTNVLEYADEESKERCFAATYGADVEMIPGSGMSGALLGSAFPLGVALRSHWLLRYRCTR